MRVDCGFRGSALADAHTSRTRSHGWAARQAATTRCCRPQPRRGCVVVHRSRRDLVAIRRVSDRDQVRVDLTGLPGVFLAAEARAAGLDARRLTTATANGQVIRLGRGAYADPLRWPTDLTQRHRLLALAAGRAVGGSAVSHVSAALLSGLPNPRTPLGRPAVTVDDAVRSRSAGSWMTLYRGATPPVSRRPRGAASEGPRSPAPSSTAPVTSRRATAWRWPMLRSGRAFRRTSRSKGCASSNVVGQASGERIWSSRFSILGGRDGWSRGPPRHFTGWGSPGAVPQVVVHDSHGIFLGRVDGYWPDLGVVGEADGRGKYLGDVEPGLDRSPRAVAQRVLASR